ncbi:hypothetical protein [Chryseobacterium sp. YIM B08800]|uniref:hypothetical protein n=1 Tax=Chryseobacterium sp. YIM B08800 TaxID=2984136 RepID=UPI00223FB3B5|nr:hypothetical protein [Chryseobacterium sp. YIM B08800]
MKNLKLIIFSFIVLLIYSCNKNADNKHSSSTKVKEITYTTTVDKASEHENKNPNFPTTKGRISDIVKKKFEIQYTAEGDLNGDGLPDQVLVLRQKSDTLLSRTVLILLKNKNSTFKLDKISDILLPDEYNEAGFKKYDPEDIIIEKGMLKVNFYNPAPYGNLFFNFKYINNDLVLTYIETYNVGAGSWQSLYYEPLKGKFTQEVTNTMEEEMPAKTKTILVKKQKFLFENSSPDDIISKVYSENDVLDN